MKFSLNWAQHVSNVDLKSIPKDELLDKIGAQLGAIEEVIEWGPRYEGIVVAKVVECVKHPDADKLSLCRIDDGGLTKNVERGQDNLIQVVCGAPNVKSGMLAAWIPPGVTVPSTIKKDPFVLEAREIRGQVSNGMLASPSELGISDNHDGILEINPAVVDAELTKPGTPFKKLFGLDDLVVDIENKMFTHRPDLFGILGIARELAGIAGQKFDSPDWYKNPSLESGNQGSEKLELEVKNDIGDLVPRFMAAPMSGITVKPSPIWLQCALTRVGIRPTSNVVDISNFVMQLTAQPTHAFDYDKIKDLSGATPTLGPRLARKGEKLTILGGKTIELQEEDMVIATDKEVVGLAGVMGGANSEVDASTKNIIIECATFDMYAIRRTAMRHGLFSDAVTRYTKGQSSLQNDHVLAYLMKNMADNTGAILAGEVHDIKSPNVKPLPDVSVPANFINDRLGSDMSAETMAQLLINVEIPTQTNGNVLTVSPPFWRTDIGIPEDIVEEVGRLYGYDHLPLTLPKRDLTPAKKDKLLETKQKAREVLSNAGANEVLTYSFVHADLMNKVGQNKDNAFQLSNALSPDLQYFRMSLVPSLLEKVHPNIKAGFLEFAIFELNQTHSKDYLEKDSQLPVEEYRLGLVFAAEDKLAEQKYAGAAYYHARKYLDYLLSNFGIEPVFEPAGNYEPKMEVGKAALAPFEKARTAIVRTKDGKLLGEIGEFRTAVRKGLKLPRFISGFELDIRQIMESANMDSSYKPLPKYPKVEQDISLRVTSDLKYADLYKLLAQPDLLPEHVKAEWTLIDIYQNKAEPNYKNITFRLSIASYQKTLTAAEVNTLLDTIADKAKTALDAVRL